MARRVLAAASCAPAGAASPFGADPMPAPPIATTTATTQTAQTAFSRTFMPPPPGAPHRARGQRRQRQQHGGDLGDDDRRRGRVVAALAEAEEARAVRDHDRDERAEVDRQRAEREQRDAAERQQRDRYGRGDGVEHEQRADDLDGVVAAVVEACVLEAADGDRDGGKGQQEHGAGRRGVRSGQDSHAARPTRSRVAHANLARGARCPAPRRPVGGAWLG
ncbi:MAG: hypothetical protein ACXVSX_11620 [Solirubrobacteraceae bacterium]